MPKVVNFISVRWLDGRVKPSLHPAFDKAELREDGYWYLTYPNFPHNAKGKKVQREWAKNKVDHLRSFGVVGEILDNL